MARNYQQRGDIQEFTAPTGGVVAGNLYIFQNLCVVALASAAATAKFQGQITGTWDDVDVKASQAAASKGSRVFLDNTGTDKGQVTFTSASGLFPIGTLAEAHVANATKAVVRLDGVATVAV